MPPIKSDIGTASPRRGRSQEPLVCIFAILDKNVADGLARPGQGGELVRDGRLDPDRDEPALVDPALEPDRAERKGGGDRLEGAAGHGDAGRFADPLGRGVRVLNERSGDGPVAKRCGILLRQSRKWGRIKGWGKRANIRQRRRMKAEAQAAMCTSVLGYPGGEQCFLRRSRVSR